MDIPPGGREYVTLAKVSFHEDVETGKTDVSVGLTVPDWQQHDFVDLTIEAYDDDGTLGRGRFRYQRPRIEDGKYVLGTLPVITELPDQ